MPNSTNIIHNLVFVILVGGCASYGTSPDTEYNHDSRPTDFESNGSETADVESDGGSTDPYSDSNGQSSDSDSESDTNTFDGDSDSDNNLCEDNTENSAQGVTFSGKGVASNAGFITGWEFHTAMPIRVTHLGQVDRPNDGISHSTEVGIWNVQDGTLLDSVTVSPQSVAEPSGMGSTYYEPINPLDLPPGNYIVAAQTNGETFYYDQSHATAPGISWVAGKATTLGPLPNNASSFHITRTDTGSYFGANFKFQPLGSFFSLTAPGSRAVFQRDDTNRARVTIAGTFAGSIGRIEARAIPRTGYAGTDTGWQIIDNAPCGGVFSGVLTIDGGFYDLETRAFANNNQLGQDTVERVGVGEVFIMAGQSNSANHGAPPQSADDDRVSAYNLNTNLWQHADDPQPYASGKGGSPWPELGDLLAAAYDIPVGIVSVGVGSTSVSQWLPGQNYGKISKALNALLPYGVRAILWHQGESDSLAKTTFKDYAETLESIIVQSRLDAGFDIPWGVALASYHPHSSLADESQIIAGQQTVITTVPFVFQGAFTDDFHINNWLSDTVHFNQTGLNQHAARWFEQIDKHLLVE